MRNGIKSISGFRLMYTTEFIPRFGGSLLNILRNKARHQFLSMSPAPPVILAVLPPCSALHLHGEYLNYVTGFSLLMKQARNVLFNIVLYSSVAEAGPLDLRYHKDTLELPQVTRCCLRHKYFLPGNPGTCCYQYCWLILKLLL